MPSNTNSRINTAIAIAATLTVSGSMAQARDGAGHREGIRAFRDAHPELSGREARQLLMNSAPQASNPSVQDLAHHLGGNKTHELWQNRHNSNSNSLRTVQNIGNEINNIRSGVDLDLNSTSANIVLGSKLLKNGSSVTITIGGVEKTLSAGSQVTPGEYVAVKQALEGQGQSVVLDAQGRASGGTVSFDSITGNHDKMRADSLVVPENVNVIGDFSRSSDFRLTGDLVNSGSVYATSTRKEVRSGSISADDILNSGSITSNVDLTLNARGDIQNTGVIEGTSNLTLNAGGSVSNNSRIGATGNVNVLTNNLTNSGTIESTNASINVAPQGIADLTVTNGGGTFNALNGDINIGIQGADKIDTTITGGNFHSNQVNLHSGDGTLNFKVNDVTGLVNATAGIAHITASTDNLQLGAVEVTGDPVVVNLTGDVTISSTMFTNGAPLAVLAFRDVFTTGSTVLSTTGGSGVDSGNLLIVAGANLVDTGTTIEITAGAGGGVVLSNSSGISLSTNATNAKSGDITIVAFAGGSGNGNIFATGAINGFSNGGTGGTTNIIMPGSISLGDVTTGTNAFLGSSGPTSIQDATAVITGGTKVVVNNTTGAILSGGFAAGGLSTNQIQTGTITSATSNLTIKTGSLTAGVGVLVGGSGINTSGSLSSGSVTIQAGGAYTGSINTSSGGIGGNVSLTISAGTSANISLPSITTTASGAGNVVITAPITALDTQFSTRGSISGNIFITFTGGPVNVLTSNFDTRSTGASNSGNITLLNPGGAINFAPTLGSTNIQTGANGGGNHGNVFIQAPTITSSTSTININTVGPGNPAPTGDVTFVGTLTIPTTNLTINSAHNVTLPTLTALNLSVSAANNINADNINLDATAPQNVQLAAGTDFFAGSVTVGGSINAVTATDDGPAGNIILSSGVSGSITVGGNMDVSGYGTGTAPAGNITMNAGTGGINATQLFAFGQTGGGNGGTVSISSFGPVSISNIFAEGRGTGGAGGVVNISVNQAGSYSFNTPISAVSNGSNATGGSVTVTNGVGDLIVNTIPNVAPVTSGDGGTIQFVTPSVLNFPASISLLSANAVGAGHNGGHIYMFADSINPQATTFTVVANGTGGSTPGSVGITTSSQTSPLIIGASTGQIDLGTHQGIVNIDASSNVSILQPLSLQGTAVIQTHSGGEINLVNTLDASSIRLLASGNIILGNNISANNGIVAITNKNIIDGGNPFNIQAGGSAIALISGADYSSVGADISVNGVSGPGGNVSLPNLAILDSQGGNLTVIGMNGGVNISNSSIGTYDGNPAHIAGSVAILGGNAAAANVLANGINLGITAVEGSSDVYIQTTQPVTPFSVGLSNNTGNVDPLTVIGGTIFPDSSVNYSTIHSVGSVSIIAGQGVDGVLISTSFAAHPGDVSIQTGPTGVVSLGTISTSANFANATGGDISITAGTGGVFIDNALSAKALGSDMNGGDVSISSTGSLQLRFSSLIDVSGQGAGHTAGSITISVAGLSNSGLAHQLITAGNAGADSGDVSITTATGAIVIGAGGLEAVQIVAGAQSAVTITSGSTITINSPLVVDVLSLTVPDNSSISQSAGQITANTLNLQVGNNSPVTLNSLTNSISHLNSTTTGNSIVQVSTASNIAIDTVSGSQQSLQVEALGSATISNTAPISIAGVGLSTDSGSINVNFQIDAQTDLLAVTGPININADIGNSGSPTTVNSGATITGTGTIFGSSIALTAAADVGTGTIARVQVNTPSLVLNLADDAYLRNTSSVATAMSGTVTGGAGIVFDLDSLGGGALTSTASFSPSSVSISSAGPLTVSNPVATSGTLNLQGFNNVAINANVGSGTATTNISSTTGSISGTGTAFGASVGLFAAINIGTSTSSRQQVNTPQLTVSALSGGAFINEVSGTLSIKTSTVGGILDVTAPSTIQTTAGNNISAGNLILDAGSSIAIASTITGTGATFTANGSVTTSGAGTVDSTILSVTSSNADIGTSTSSRFVTGSTNASFNAPTGNVFVSSTGGGLTIDAPSAALFTAGTFDIVATNNLSSTAGSTISAHNISLSSTTGGLSFGGSISAGNDLTLSAFFSITNSNFQSSVTGANVHLISTNNDIGISTSSRFTSGAANITASAPLGDVFLNATGPAVHIGTSNAGGTFDLQTTGDMLDGTITAPTVVLNSTAGNIGDLNAFQRFAVDASTLTANASGYVFVRNDHTTSTLVGTNTAGTIGWTILTAGDLAINANVTGPDITINSGGTLTLPGGSLNATNLLFLQGTAGIDTTGLNTTIAAAELSLASSSGAVGSSTNPFTASVPSVTVNANTDAFLNLTSASTPTTTLHDSTARSLTVVGNTLQLLLDGNTSTANGEMSVTMNGLGSTINVAPAASLTTTEGDINLIVTDQTKSKTPKIFIGNGANIKASGTALGVGEVFIGTGTLPFTTSTKNKKPPKGVTVTNVAPGQVFLGKKGIGIVKKATGISLNALGRNLVFNIGDKEKKNVITLDSNVTITADPPSNIATLTTPSNGIVWSWAK